MAPIGKGAQSRAAYTPSWAKTAIELKTVTTNITRKNADLYSH